VETTPEIVPFIPEPDMILTPQMLEDTEQVASISEPDPAIEATSLEGVGEAVQPPPEDSPISSANEQILFDVAEMKPEPKGLDGIFNGIGDFTKSKYGLNISYNPSSTIAAAADGTWDRTIADFDVTAFVRDVAKTGAGYVIFSVGQTTGYYAAPNNAYLKYTETELGQYVPQRDLVKEIAQGLKKIGVATLVYVAAEGPTAAPAKIINNFPVRSDRAEDPEFRTEFNQVIREWSERWGDDVVGWWLDGAWVDGYTNPIDGQANLNALIEATKAGNPEAIVAANPASGKSDVLSDRQDFLAGEDTRFSEYPSESPYLAAAADSNSNVPAWHTMSYLGNNWGDFSADRYSSQELIDYIQAVNRGSGVVTMDVGVSANGNLSDQQVAQLEAVKAELRIS
jgi:alpha-L-fucosidase